MVKVRSAEISDIPAIKSLLLASQLLPDGIEDHIADFFVAEEEGKIVGAGGFENCGAGVGLLRSFAVSPERRNRGIAAQLYGKVIAHASHSGVTTLYLLTTTAQGYFARFGFSPIARAEAPESIRNTTQFRDSCPASAVLMFREIEIARGVSACVAAPTPESAAKPEIMSKAPFDSGY